MLDILILTIIASFFAAAFLFVGYIIGTQRRKWLENIGESLVRNVLMKTFSGINFHLMNNITLPFEDGTTQVDHILLSRTGIFVVETKHYSGWIFGNEKDRTWTQVIFRFKNSFMNPIHQNYKHIIAIKSLLDFIPSELIHSIVVFTGDAVIKSEQPKGVLYIDQISEYINSFKDIVISENRMQFCVGRIETTRLSISRKTDVEHQAYLINKHYTKKPSFDNE